VYFSITAGGRFRHRIEVRFHRCPAVAQLFSPYFQQENGVRSTVPTFDGTTHNAHAAGRSPSGGLFGTSEAAVAQCEEIARDGRCRR
jgi:hypothetical protein